MVMRGLIFRFNGQRQGFNGAHVKRSHLRYMVLFVLQLAQIQAVRAINYKHGRQCQQRGLPANFLREPSKHGGQSAAGQIIWQRPEITISPDLLQLLVFREGNDGCYRKRIEKKINSGREHEQERRIWMQPRGPWSAISKVRRRNRNSRAGDIEEYLFNTWPPPPCEQTLRQDCRTSKN